MPSIGLALQANKRQKLMDQQEVNSDESADSSDGDGDGDEEEWPSTQLLPDLGSAPGANGKYRDENFYLGYDRGDNRYAEEGFAVRGPGQDMVLDLAGDDNVSSPFPTLACAALLLSS